MLNVKRWFKRKIRSSTVCLEVRADGIAWAASGGSGAFACGFVDCSPAKRAGALSQLVSDQGWQGCPATLVLPLDQYGVFQLERPDGVSDAELPDALRWKLRDLLDYSSSDAVCDVFPYPSDASRGSGDQVNVVAARKSTACELVRLVDDAGLALERIDIAELALRNFASVLDPKGYGVALIHMRDSYGQMIICKGSVLYLSRRLDVTAADLRDATLQENAVQSLALEIQRSLDYFESQLGQIPPRIIQLVARDSVLPLTSMLSGYVATPISSIDWAAQGLSAPLDSRCLAAWSAGQPVVEGEAR